MLKKRYKNWIRYITNNRKNIFGLRITTTWKCNYKCETCSIWEIKNAGQNDLTVSEIDKLTKSKYFKETEYITLSGGEPTLREDIVDYISTIHRNIPKARINMTTNAHFPEREEKIFKELKQKNPGIKFGSIGLSLNGPKEIHDKTRGVPGSFERVIETYNRIKGIVPVYFSFTFCKDNIDQFEWTMNFAKELGTRAYICWTVMNNRFKISDEDLVFWKPGMGKVLEMYTDSISKNEPGLKGIWNNLLQQPPNICFSYLYDHVINKRIMPCYAGRQIVHIDPEGNVYPCNFKLTDDRIIGNLRNKSFDEIWESLPKKILKEIDCGECMYPNGLCGDSEIYPSIRNHPLTVMKWYLKKIITGQKLIKEPEIKK